MMGKLLVRGMIAGLIAGMLGYGLSKVIGEPQVDRAIAYEEQVNQAMGNMAEPEPVSRETQAGLGLLTGLVTYSVAIGGLFSVAFASAYKRGNSLGPRTLSAAIGLAAFVAVVAAPALKYPPSPPAASDPSTIGMRTAMYFVMLAISVTGMVASATLATYLRGRIGGWQSLAVALAGYVCLVALTQWGLPSGGTIPRNFPIETLYGFRIAAMAVQLSVWITIAVVFGYFASALFARKGRGILGAGIR